MAVARHFGSNARLWLFGSRVYDHSRGGDFDIYLETGLTDPDQVIERKLKVLSELRATPEFEGEKIDLVVRPLADWSVDLPIYEAARREGIAL